MLILSVITSNIPCLTLGMLSKSMGQILRISAAMHVLFHMDSEDPLPEVISESAIEAAIDFVEVCCQQTAYITGRGDIKNELDLIEAGNQIQHICTLNYFCSEPSNMHLHNLY